MSREVKIGILAIIAIITSVWGYKFVKGQNLFAQLNSFYTTFDDVTALAPSAPVLLNGLKVGQVTSIKLNKDNVKKMDVTFTIDGDIPVPKDAVIKMKSEGVVGGKILFVDFNKPCNGSDCAESGSYLQNENYGLIESMLGEEGFDGILKSTSTEVTGLISDLGAEGSTRKIDQIVNNLDEAIKNIAKLSEASANLVSQSSSRIASTMKNFEEISKNLADNNKEIGSIIKNLNSVTQEIKNAGLGATVKNTNEMVTDIKGAVGGLDKSLESLDATIQRVNTLMNNINGGQGTLGKLVTDRDLYLNLEKTTKNLSLLLQDIRLNPKRYLNVSLIGGKSETYELPEKDPAFRKN